VVLERTAGGTRLAGTPGSVTGPADSDPASLLGAGARELLATITGAGLAPDQLAAIHVTGDPALGQQAAELVTEVLGDTPSPAIDLGTGAVLGAAAEAQPDCPVRRRTPWAPR
jgi:hypothetical protein